MPGAEENVLDGVAQGSVLGLLSDHEADIFPSFPAAGHVDERMCVAKGCLSRRVIADETTVLHGHRTDEQGDWTFSSHQASDAEEAFVTANSWTHGMACDPYEEKAFFGHRDDASDALHWCWFACGDGYPQLFRY